MRIIKGTLLLILLLLISCIEEYKPQIKTNIKDLVIEGHISDDGEEHFVRVSYSAQLNNLSFNPINGCKVSVSDNRGNIYYFEQKDDGVYCFHMHPDDVRALMEFRLKVILPDGQVYFSDEETALRCPPVDSIYYTEDDRNILDPDEDLLGIQIVADYDGGSSDTRFIKFNIQETWEYTTPYIVQFLYDSLGLHPAPGYLHDYHRCWKTEQVKDILILTSDGLTENKIKRHPLHFVSNQTNRLQYKYSMLVTQQSISEKAYYYFYELNKRVKGADDLYDTQPANMKGNIHLEGHPEKSALGYFYVSLSKTKRVFIRNRFPYKMHRYDGCTLRQIYDWSLLTASGFPYYINPVEPAEGATGYGRASKFCFDCTLNGGSIVKPDFWDE